MIKTINTPVIRNYFFYLNLSNMGILPAWKIVKNFKDTSVARKPKILISL